MTSLLDRFIPSLGAVDDNNGWASANPLDDYWYTPRGGISSSGALVTQETALKISAFFACVRVIAETVQSAPLMIYRKLPNGDREPAPEHPLYRLLHGDEPNDFQTSGEWLETHTAHTAMRGISYSRIRRGRKGPFDHFDYIVPDRVTPERLPSGALRFKVRSEDGSTTEIVPIEEMFRFPGLGFNGVTGQSVLEHARETLGISISLQKFTGSTFSNGVRTSGVLEHPGKFQDEKALERLRGQWQEVYGGSSNAGKTVILEEGMKYQSVSMKNTDAQMLESEHWQVSDVARFFRMPLIMIGEYVNSTNWGTGIEQTQLGFITFCMLPWFVRWEHRIDKDLVNPFGGDYYAEFNLENLLRGNVKDRFEAYNIAAGGNAPWMNRAEIRKRENLNAGPPELEDFLQPMNMGEAGKTQPRGTVTRPAAAALEEAETIVREARVDPRLRGYATVLATSIVNKETIAMQRLARKHADDGQSWAAEVTTLYEGLAEQISRDCYVAPEEARTFATQARERWLGAGVMGMEAAQPERVQSLLALMLQGEARAPVTRRRVERDGRPWLTVTEEVT